MWRFDWKVGSGDGLFSVAAGVLFIRRQVGTRRANWWVGGHWVPWKGGGGRQKKINLRDRPVSLPRRGSPKHAPLLHVCGVLQQTNWVRPNNDTEGCLEVEQCWLGCVAGCTGRAGRGRAEVRGPKREGKRGAQTSSEGEGEGEDKRKKWRVSAEDQMRGSRQAIVFLVRAAGGGKRKNGRSPFQFETSGGQNCHSVQALERRLSPPIHILPLPFLGFLSPRASPISGEFCFPLPAF